MELEQLRLFLTVAHEGSFQSAAEKRFVSQRAISKQMTRLEHELGTSLFERKANRIELTLAGRYFVNKAREILNEMNDSIHSLHQLAGPTQPVLNIGYISVFEGTLVQQNVVNYQQQCVDMPITFNLIEEDIEALLSDLTLGNLDCAYIFDYGIHHNFDKMQLVGHQVMQGEMVVGVSRQSALSQKSVLTEADLNNQEILYYSATGYDYLKHGFLATLDDAQNLKFNFTRVTTFEHMQMLVATNSAIALYPQGLDKNVQCFDQAIKYVPLIRAENQKFSVQFVHREDNHLKALQRFRASLNLNVPDN